MNPFMNMNANALVKTIKSANHLLSFNDYRLVEYLESLPIDTLLDVAVKEHEEVYETHSILNIEWESLHSSTRPKGRASFFNIQSQTLELIA